MSQRFFVTQSAISSSTPSEYERAGHIPAFVLDDIADWITKKF